jgi:hypothetical protein
MGKKKRKARHSKKIRTKAKWIQKQHPEYVRSLSLTTDEIKHSRKFLGLDFS